MKIIHYSLVAIYVAVLPAVKALRGVRSVSDFNREFPISVISVPILGPVEHHEPLFQKEAARLARLRGFAAQKIIFVT